MGKNDAQKIEVPCIPFSLKKDPCKGPFIRGYILFVLFRDEPMAAAQNACSFFRHFSAQGAVWTKISRNPADGMTMFTFLAMKRCRPGPTSMFLFSRHLHLLCTGCGPRFEAGARVFLQATKPCFAGVQDQ